MEVGFFMPKNISKDIQENLNYIENILKDNDDLVIRHLEVGEIIKVKMAIIYIDGLVDKGFISEYAVGSLIQEEELKSFTEEGYRTSILEVVKEEVLATSEIQEQKSWDTIIRFILSGDTLLLINNSDQGIIIGTRGAPSRGIGEPETEAVIRGPREGFTEVGRFNTSLIRRRLRDHNLRVKIYSIGRRTKTDVSVMYIDDIVDPKLLNEVNKRLEDIDIDGILDSSTLEYLIEDNYLSPFPQIGNTERPDSVAASLLEGRIAIIVDNSPFVLMVPATLGTLMQSTEDYYTRWIEASIIRLLRLLAALLIFLPSPLYVAITSYHPGLLPTKLTYFLAASRLNVPFPSVLEALLMEITMELLREAGTRMSGPIGSTIGIVGGLIIGQAAVEAGVVSPLMIIIVAVATIATFVIPSYELSAAFRLFKFVLIILASIFGLYGIVIGVAVVGTHLVTLNSFGIPLTSPYSGLGVEEGDLKDTLVKAPLQRLWLRPGFTFPRNKKRMKRENKDE